MQLTQAQREAYDRDGFIILPNLVSLEEVARIKQDLAEACQLDDERVIREKGGGDVRIVYGLHDCDGPTGSRAVDNIARSPRLLESAKEILGDDAYLFHTKCNFKEAITGDIWQWHQDFGVWREDGLSRPQLVTTLLMLDGATEIGGCLYFVPGSHTEGDIEAPYDSETTTVGLVAITKEQMTDLISRHGEPVPVIGGPGTVAMFHPWIVHGSGHNMSIHSRWQLYFVYNAVSNTMAPVATARPQYKASGRAVALQIKEDAVLETA